MKNIAIPLLFCLFFSSTVFAEEIRVMYNSNYYPLEFTNERGKPDGFVIDLIYALAREAALEITFTEGNWKQREQKLFNGDIDLTPGYKYDSGNDSIVSSKILFSVPFSLVLRGDLKSPGLKNLGSRIPLFSSGDSSELLLSTLIPSENLIRTKSWSDAIKALNIGYGDFTVISTLHKDLLMEEYGGALTVPDDFKLELPFVLYTTAWNRNRLEKINNGLSIIRASGEYGRIYRKWFGEEPDALVTEPEEGKGHLIILFIVAFASIIVLITLNKRKVKS